MAQEEPCAGLDGVRRFTTLLLPCRTATVILVFTAMPPKQRNEVVRSPTHAAERFNAVMHTVNAAGPRSQARWDAYQRALRALNAGL